MANTFKSFGDAGAGTSAQTVYTAPASTTSTVIGMTLANVSTGGVSADVQLVKSGGTSFYLAKSAPVPLGGTFVVVGGEQKLVLETGDRIDVTSDTASSIDTIVSVLEIS